MGTDRARRAGGNLAIRLTGAKPKAVGIRVWLKMPADVMWSALSTKRLQRGQERVGVLGGGAHNGAEDLLSRYLREENCSDGPLYINFLLTTLIITLTIPHGDVGHSQVMDTKNRNSPPGLDSFKNQLKTPQYINSNTFMSVQWRVVWKTQ
jgi:hypothetical protein